MTDADLIRLGLQGEEFLKVPSAALIDPAFRPTRPHFSKDSRTISAGFAMLAHKIERCMSYYTDGRRFEG